ncbi:MULTISPECIES: ATP-binding protein [Streptomyces]|uniref:Anti-sigma regulatory factor (Ser/Thr protein kinase) n=1 Tax=Streptomyces radiopugnans TaxID=403935 RepID=A0A1H9F6S2_9ACTN|nr:ATP-binding protein [Streptomyces radiopugnans]SEQ32978.1 Anti-sigma regulatory factor (Ser/Thr protein kinase) [Streptomyces radiopugnans]
MPFGGTAGRPALRARSRPPLRRTDFALPARAESVAKARRLVRGLLAGWGADEETCDTAALVVSELFTNTVVHTGSGSVVCELREETGSTAREGTPLRLEVCGRRPGPPTCPAPRTRLPQEEHGRGLLLVEAVSEAWGIRDVRGCGWSVWARLPAAAAER